MWAGPHRATGTSGPGLSRRPGNGDGLQHYPTAFLALLLLILIFTFAVYAEVGLPLFLALTLMPILDMGVLMDSGPAANLAIPLLMAMGPIVVLFYTISWSPRHSLLQLPGSGKHPGQID